MTDAFNTALLWSMRAGYSARGAVYFLVGALAIFAAINGGEAEGATGALNHLSRQPFGTALVGCVALGLIAYGSWRLTSAFLDLQREGDDAKAYGSRLGEALSGGGHFVLAATAVTIMIKGAQSGGDSSENWSAAVMAAPFGRWLVALAGAVTLSVAAYLFMKSWRAAYRKKIRRTPTTQRLAPVIRFGLAAHGFVLLIIGGLLVYAAWTATPENAAGVGEALMILETQPFGRTLLGLTGAGMIAFSVYCAVEAAYRIAPKIMPRDLPSLAS